MVLGLWLLAAIVAPEANIAPAAQVTCSPALDGSADELVDDRLGGKAFIVGSEGHGAVTLTWDHPRRVRAARVYQGSEVYRMDALVVEADTGEGAFRELGTARKTPLFAWIDVRFEPVTVRSLRIRCTEGESKGRRAHPVFAEVQVIGDPLPTDTAEMQRLGRSVRSLSDVPAPPRETPLVRDGRPPCLLIPADPAAHRAGDALRRALTERLGVAPTVADSVSAAPLGRATVIALGNLLDNELICRLYFNKYAFEDNLFPGPGGYTIRTVHDPYPWGGGQDVIVVGASRTEQLTPAVERLLALLAGQGGATVLPHTLLVAPERKLSATQREQLLAAPTEPSFTAFRQSAEQYAKTGDEAHALKAIAALDIMAGVYRDHPARRTPWPEETTSGPIMAAWDTFEECPLIDQTKRLGYVNAFLCFARDLVHHCSGYGALGTGDTVSWNHTTFPLLGLYYGGRYFQRYHGLKDAREWLAKAAACFLAQSRSWKPQEDADGYLTLTMGHTIDYCLAEWDLRFFESGLMKQYADYVVACGDNRQWPSGFGDSGVSASPSMARAVLPLAYWWTRDGAYRWILEQVGDGGWANPYWPEVAPVPAERFVGLAVHKLDHQLDEYTRKRSFYGEPVAEGGVPAAEAYDKIAFRESWHPGDQYLLLDGYGRGKHLHYDTNGITEFVQGGERWLLDHDYLTRNTTEHSMLSVLRDGRAAELVPALAGLSASGEVSGAAAVETHVDGYNGVDWERRVLWSKGAWFLVHDTATAREPGSYDLELTWKTIDRGGETVDDQGRFTASRGSATDSHGLLQLADREAGNGQVVVMTAQDSRLVFAVELPAGECAVTLIGKGGDGSSDSLWLSLDGAPAVAFHVPQNALGPARSAFEADSSRPVLAVAKAGKHLVSITLREHAPVRLDRLEFAVAGAQPVVVEAESAEAPGPALIQPGVPSAFHIAPAVPVGSRVTRHVRQGIAVPVAILHQRRSGDLAAGQSVAFCSLLYATDERHPHEYRIAALRDRVYRVEGETTRLAGFGADHQGRWACDAAGWLIDGDLVSLLAARRLKLGGELTFDPPVDAELRAGAGELSIMADQETRITASGAGLGDGRTALTIAGGHHLLKVTGLTAAALAEAGTGPAAATAGAEVKAPRATAAPRWTADTAPGPVERITPADLDGDGRPELLVASGTSAVALDADGKVRWSYLTGGRVRDVSAARLAAGAPPTVLVSSADTWLSLLDPAGREQRRQQMTGIYFSADHGERPWPLYLTRGIDVDGDGVSDLLVTTLGSMEMWGLDKTDLHKLWRYEFCYHGCMDLRAIDLDGDGRREILAADKYGSLHVARADGKKVMSSYTSIGDVAFDAADFDGDGKLEMVVGSSTGDLAAVDLNRKTLWRFDNFGYPVERVLCADLDADGRTEVLIGSGTGYLYCLAGDGSERWRRRLGFAVTALAVVPDGLVAGTVDGSLTWLDGRGEPRRTVDLGAPVTALAVADGQVIAGLRDGRVVAAARD